MCTRVIRSSPGEAVIVGRNMDYHCDTGTNLWVLPRGLDRVDGVGGSLHWTAKYGSLIAGAYDLISVDGVNEAGLAGHILWLTESDYGTYDTSKPALSMAIWLQYFLDNFATVAEAAAWVEKTKVQVVPLADPGTGTVPAVHLALDDATGDSAIIEYVDGEPTVWHDRSYTVMTNSPTYDKQLELLKQFEGFGGTDTLPGTTLASDRFARARYYSARLPKSDGPVAAVAGMLSVIRNAAQPFRIPDPGKPEVSQTIWQTVADLTNKRYVYSSTTNPNTIWVDLDEVDFGGSARKLDLASDTGLEGDLVGNVTDKFVACAPMQFLTLTRK
ncbi:linear amide C-N hydrolase [Mycolicibacterium komossense]|uniref:Linear amide C-N hydrolase n=1 Tax=Mycolicibacterium komossense TaxID=1779 RepID=A0ABT3CDY2_9MYCO|nr:linear amide C-N hydrolase [Mycolicibacterium komossense]MCV7227699.1 linear amide C-N hydrolase [Mycolicibacterium komossense]